MLFAGLNDQPKSRRSFIFGYALQAVLVLVLVLVPLLMPTHIEIQGHQYHITQLLPLVEKPIAEEPQPKPRVHPMRQPKLALDTPEPRLIAPTAPKPKLEPVKAPEVKLVKENFDLPEQKMAAPKLAPQVKTNVFNTGSSATASVNKPVQQVQTGGFGAPDGVKAEPTRAGQANIARTGSFDLPAGEGQGNGTGGAHGVRGTVASAGFGSGTAIPPQPAVKRAALGQSGFGDTAPAEPTVKRASVQAPAVTPVEVLSKPNPIYTDEARKKKIEGEVILEATFTSDGQVRVMRVVQGLGYGLDEAAVQAAQRIRFKPAMKDGHPFDTIAKLHVMFQLAY